MDSEYCVIVSKVYKRYSSSTPVLNGLDMKIPTGSMYGLLGSSGCGKTTLLKCILGKLQIDSGTIELSVKNWCQVGFMPQSVSLHTELKIKEIFTFYGTIFGLFGNKLSERVSELTDLLELPPLSKLIADCSGGQQRRISLAVTLLHDPNFLLLDEPTVGLDPLLSHKIWVHLKNLSLNEKKTIIVTTHYMEEARSLHRIGLMRGGVLLAEKPPENLISDYNCSTLDDVFLQLSQIQEAQLDKNKDDYPKKSPSSKPLLRNEKSFNRNHVRAQIYKNCKWTYRNVPVTLFILFLPFISSCITSIVFRDLKTDFKIGYYSKELYNASCEVNKTIRAKGCQPSPPFSCQYIEILQEKHLMEKFESVDEGLEAIRKGQTYVLIVFPYNFTGTVIQRLNFKTPKKNETYEEEVVEVWMDNTIFRLVFNAKIDIYASLQQLMALKCKECGIPTELSHTPLSYQKLIYGKFNTISSKVFPHFLNGFLFYTTFIYTSASLLMEKSSGVLDRIQLNGVTTSELLTANFVVQFIVFNIQNILTLSAIHAVFMEDYLGSLSLMYFILVLCELFGSIFGLLVITYTESAILVNYIGVGTILTVLVTNGMMWPREGVHWLLKPLTQLIPVNMSSESYSHVMLHGFPLVHHLVYPGVLYLIVCLLGLSAFTTYRIRKNYNQL